MTKAIEYVDLEVKSRIETLLVDYVNTIDDERYEEWPAFFTKDCIYKIISKDNYQRGLQFGYLYCDNRNMLRDRILSMYKANVFEAHTYRHMINAPSITALDDGSYAVRTSYVVVRIMHDGAQEVFSTGVYEDIIVEEEGRLLFKERLVITDSTSIDALLVIPI